MKRHCQCPRMTKKDFLEITKDMPDDAVLLGFNGDSGQIELVTGLLSGPNVGPMQHSDGELPDGTFTIEICTDDIS